MATITRVFEFDSAHRVMNERVKCFNLHGHRFKVELTFEYFETGPLGYAMDFKEIKRICGDWIDENLDHSCILNPMDSELIELCKKNNWRVYTMGFGEVSDTNPSAENIASELFFIITRLIIKKSNGAQLEKIRLYETPNCWVECDDYTYYGDSSFCSELTKWRDSKGVVSYDVREDANK